jgi:hypothetical protein
MYESEKSPLTHELSYIELFNFFHLSLYHVNSKILILFSFFGTPTMNEPFVDLQLHNCCASLHTLNHNN